MELIRRVRVMQETSRGHLLRSRTIGLVPTMGALHEGHLHLVKRAKLENDIVVVSIFVNPLQFGPHEDFERYPRDSEKDMAQLERIGADAVFAPEVSSLYPQGYATHVSIDGLSNKLCGAFRPGHFTGVATVVCKLLHIALPTRAYFGQKDFQQTVIVKRMAEDLNIGTEIVVCPTIREEDGLAMSSRNQYLSPEERKAAPILYKTLTSAAEMIKKGESPRVVKQYMHAALKAEPKVAEIQYAGIYDTVTLDELVEPQRQNFLALAVVLGTTRLIDNMIVDS